MTAQEIKNIILEELRLEADLKNINGLDLTQCVIEPVKQKYIHNPGDPNPEYLWTVLEETPDKTGYKIFYDETSKQFGLAMNSGTSELLNIGYYGSFLRTLYAM